MLVAAAQRRRRRRWCASVPCMCKQPKQAGALGMLEWGHPRAPCGTQHLHCGRSRVPAWPRRERHRCCAAWHRPPTHGPRPRACYAQPLPLVGPGLTAVTAVTAVTSTCPRTVPGHVEVIRAPIDSTLPACTHNADRVPCFCTLTALHPQVRGGRLPAMRTAPHRGLRARVAHPCWRPEGARARSPAQRRARAAPLAPRPCTSPLAGDL